MRYTNRCLPLPLPINNSMSSGFVSLEDLEVYSIVSYTCSCRVLSDSTMEVVTVLVVLKSRYGQIQ